MTRFKKKLKRLFSNIFSCSYELQCLSSMAFKKCNEKAFEKQLLSIIYKPLVWYPHHKSNSPIIHWNLRQAGANDEQLPYPPHHPALQFLVHLHSVDKHASSGYPKPGRFAINICEKFRGWITWMNNKTI